ncbi:transposase [Pelagibacterium sp. H642]|uniref:transposase n=1 Tax=Pelagibacterium sp. H642 TaxID=1881069 RepID=UPI002815FD97|nr:transposase [Pelagibacterium sp. H642]WMT91920.1 transposase [Pelagibacterium sp. H642]
MDVDPRFGLFGATALLASAGSAEQFKKAAWLGLVPMKYPSGCKAALFSTGKRGSKRRRRMLIHGAVLQPMMHIRFAQALDAVWMLPERFWVANL